MRPVAALLALLALAGCAERPRSNPFDPSNPVTSGRPAGLQAISGDNLIELRWQSAGAVADAGYRVYRKLEGETDYQPISSALPISSTGFSDFGTENGKRHDYRLYFLLGGELSGLPAEDHATPGPARAWVADLSDRRVLRLSADGRRVASSFGGFFGPSFLGYDATNRLLWVSDTYDGSVKGMDAGQQVRVEIAGLSEPMGLAVDSTRDAVWICDQARDAVYHYSVTGAPAFPSSLEPIDTPIAAAVDLVDGSVWVCEHGGDGRVRHYLGNGVPDGAVSLPLPSRVAVDSLTRDAWVTSLDAGLVVRISPGVVAQDTVALAGPIGIAVDHRRGRIWVADARGNAVVALRRSGLVEFRVGGLNAVREVAVNLATGECWASLLGDPSVVKIGPDGLLRERVVGMKQPYGLAVDPGN